MNVLNMIAMAVACFVVGALVGYRNGRKDEWRRWAKAWNNAMAIMFKELEQRTVKNE